jgi:hypothetical protein
MNNATGNNICYLLTGDPKREEIIAQMKWFKQMKFSGVLVVPWQGLIHRFMTDEFLDLIAVILEQAKELDLDVWIWDDWSFPSGFGGGHVTANKEYRAKYVKIVHDQILREGDELTLPTGERFLSASAIGVDSMHYHGACGKATQLYPDQRGIIRRVATQNERILIICWEYYSTVESVANKEGVPQEHICTVDMLSREATIRFTQLIHQRYYQKFKPYFKSVIKGFFYDEPNLPTQFPWTLDFATQFKKRKEYDIVEHLPFLIAYAGIPEHGGMSIENRKLMAKISKDYNEVWTDLAAENFYGVLQKWCHRKGILSIGHQDMDDRLYTLCSVSGNLFKNSYYNDLPGLDVIWEQIKQGTFTDFPRFAGSAAKLYGKPYAMSESLAHMGQTLTPQEIVYILTHQLIRNVSLFFLMEHWHTMPTGSRSPVYHIDINNSIYVKYGERINQRISNLVQILADGTDPVKTLIYLPIYEMDRLYRSLAHPYTGNMNRHHWEIIGDIVKELIKLQQAFYYVWEEMLTRMAVDKNGLMDLGGNHYSRILIPPRCQLTQATVEKLKEFADNGGTIILFEQYYEELYGFTKLCNRVGDLIEYLGSERIFKEDTDGISMTSRITQDSIKYYLLNESDKTQILHPVKNNPDLLEYDLQCDAYLAIDNKVNIKPGELKILTTGTQKARYKSGEIATSLIGTTQTIDGLTYEFAFNIDYPAEHLLLELEKLCHIAEVFLDGETKGEIVLAPYRLVVDNVAPGKHVLQIHVSGTGVQKYLTDPVTEIRNYGFHQDKDHFSGNYKTHVLPGERARSIIGIKGEVTLYHLNWV